MKSDRGHPVIGHVPHCKECGTKGIINEDYDCYYCKMCWIWLEPTCSDPKCHFCHNRPDEPTTSKNN